MQRYDPCYSFDRGLSVEAFRTFQQQLNENGLFAQETAAWAFAAYCNQITEQDSHAIETEIDWHPIFVFAVEMGSNVPN